MRKEKAAKLEEERNRLLKAKTSRLSEQKKQKLDMAEIAKQQRIADRAEKQIQERERQIAKSSQDGLFSSWFGMPKAPADGLTSLSMWLQNGDGTITGYVSSSVEFEIGTKITTSPVKQGVDAGTVVKTVSGSQYRLGTAAKEGTIVVQGVKEFTLPFFLPKTTGTQVLGKSEEMARRLSRGTFALFGRGTKRNQEIETGRSTKGFFFGSKNIEADYEPSAQR